MRYIWTRQHTQRKSDHLQILRASRRRNGARLDANIVQNCTLEPWDQEVGTFVGGLSVCALAAQPCEDVSTYPLFYTGEPVEHHGSIAAGNIVHASLYEQGTHTKGHWTCALANQSGQERKRKRSHQGASRRGDVYIPANLDKKLVAAFIVSLCARKNSKETRHTRATTKREEVEENVDYVSVAWPTMKNRPISR